MSVLSAHSFLLPANIPHFVLFIHTISSADKEDRIIDIEYDPFSSLLRSFTSRSSSIKVFKSFSAGEGLKYCFLSL